jgi:glycosyl hydrolase family 56 (putative hyaluronidase)
MMMNRIAATFIAAAGLALSPITVHTEAASLFTSSEPGDDFEVLWGVEMFDEVEEGVDGRNWQEELDFDDAEISRDLIFLTQFRVGAFPKAGIHMFERDPSLWDLHYDKIRRDMDLYVPEDFTGIVVIDYERWRTTWTRTRNVRDDEQPVDALDHDFLLDWRDAIRDTRTDEYFGHGQDTRLQYVFDSYEEMALRFYIETIRECKRLRPNAQWTFFNYPRLRYNSQETPRGVIGYGDLSHEASRINDRIQSLFDEMDVIVPSIYPQHWTVEGNNFIDELPRNKQNRVQGANAFITTNVTEALRLGRGKPVYPIISLRYYMNLPQHPWLNDLNIRLAIQFSEAAGASGLILWEGIGTREEWSGLQAMMLDRLAPAVRELVGTADDNGGGSDGGDGGDDMADGAGGSGQNTGKGRDSIVSGVLTIGGGN